MKHDWKPGDLAVTQFGRSVVDSGNRCGHYDSQPHWHHIAGGWDLLDAHSTARPLVVIDPEDREQVERLVRACPDDWAFTQDEETVREVVAHMQTALREFANPTPCLEEPTGLGAVVEDRDGRRYVRSERHEDAPWDKFREYVGGFLWSDIPAVRVLSEGV